MCSADTHACCCLNTFSGLTSPVKGPCIDHERALCSRDHVLTLQGLFKNKEACPKSVVDKPWTNLNCGGFPYMPGVKYIQLLDEESEFSGKK